MEDWRESLDDDLKGEKILQFDHKKEDLISVPKQLVKMYVDTKKMVGNSIQIPGKDAKPEEVAKFYTRLGAPENVDGYELKIPDGVPETYTKTFGEIVSEAQTWFKGIAKEIGLTKSQAGKLFTGFMGREVENYTKGQEAYEAGTKTAEDVLKKEWGNNYEKNLDLAKRAYRVFVPEGSDAEKGLFNDRALGDQPHVIKLFHGIASQIGEDKLPMEKRTVDLGDLTKEKLMEMERDPRYSDPTKRDEQYVQMVQDGWKKLYPGEQKLAPTDRGEVV